ADALGWTRLTDGGGAPPAIVAAAAAWTDTHGMVLFGGTNGGATGLNETWQFAPRPLPGWTKIDDSASPALPAGRYDHSLIYDAENRRLVLFGGVPQADAPARNDLWFGGLGDGGVLWAQMQVDGG